MTVPGSEHLLDFRAESEEQFLAKTPLQDMQLNDDESETKHYNAMDFKRKDGDPLPADFYKTF